MNEIEFIDELKKINIYINEDQLSKLETFYSYLIEYNLKTNITSITDKKDVYLKHFYDSLTLTKAIDLNNISVCDVGTGAGFPGIVLKILYPSIKLTLIESITKKTKFLEEIIDILNLKDIIIINDRVEEYSKTTKDKYDLVTCRAVSSLNIISELCIPITKINGYFIPMKGELNESTLFLEKLNCKIEKIIEFNLPFENSKRTLIKIKKIKETNSIYPRSYKIIKQSPLK